MQQTQSLTKVKLSLMQLGEFRWQLDCPEYITVKSLLFFSKIVLQDMR